MSISRSNHKPVNVCLLIIVSVCLTIPSNHGNIRHKLSTIYRHKFSRTFHSIDWTDPWTGTWIILLDFATSRIKKIYPSLWGIRWTFRRRGVESWGFQKRKIMKMLTRNLMMIGVESTKQSVLVFVFSVPLTFHMVLMHYRPTRNLLAKKNIIFRFDSNRTKD